MIAGSDALEADVVSGAFGPAAEDVHGALERGLVERVGAESGGRLRAGRSRDQIATLIRMYCGTRSGWSPRARSASCTPCTARRAATSVSRCRAIPPVHAQPVLLSHHLLAHGSPLLRDPADRLRDLDRRLAVSPYGLLVLARTSLGLDPEAVAAELGFHSSVPNSIDGTSSRDCVAEAGTCSLSWLSTCPG